MAFTQTTFLGSSIRSFNATLGWSNQASQLNVSLADDNVNGDSFSPRNPGDPVSFTYAGWNFNGLFQSYKTTEGPNGNPLFEVTVVDPREILEGVQLILDGYNGITYGVPNILNVYGFLEAVSFGNAHVNEGGMPWQKVRDTVALLTSLAQIGTYGGPIRFMNSNYKVNLNSLPAIPSHYRIAGGNVTLMEFIVDVCEAGGCEFFITMDEITTGNFEITVHVVNRRVYLQTLGSIHSFVGQTSGVANKEYGLELINNTTGKFVVGGNIESVYLQFSDAGESNDYTDDTIWPFWGFNVFGDVVLGTGDYNTNEHKFTLDYRGINIFGVGAEYPTDIGEMRAALDSYESWLFYLMIKDTDSTSPQYQRYSKLGMISTIGNNIFNIFDAAPNFGALKAITPLQLSPLTQKQAKLARRIGSDPNEENVARLYDYVRTYASEYYGRKFMVRIPFIFTSVEDETANIRLSQEPTDTGFLDESQWDSAIGLNLLPLDINRLTTQEGKIEAYVRFLNAPNLNLAYLSQDDYVLSDDASTVFVKCRVYPGVVYINTEARFSPRAVIELSGPVRKITDDLSRQLFDGQIFQYIYKILTDDAAATGTNKYGTRGLTNAQRRGKVVEVRDSIFGHGGSDFLFLGQEGLAVIPDLAGLPLRNNQLTYGPWYGYGLNGKMEFERDDSLVPWNYGGFTVMDAVGEAKVTESLINQQFSETGTVEFPDVPTVRLGNALVNAGPLVTDVSVNISEGGATTTYRMQLSPRFGRFARANAERLTRLAKTAQRFRRLFRELLKTPSVNLKSFSQRDRALLKQKPARTSPHTSHSVLHGEIVTNNETGLSDVIVTSQPLYNLQPTMYDNYTNKGIMSFDGLLTPFATSALDSGIPHFKTIDGGSSINRNDLNRFDSTHNIEIIAYDSGIPENGLHRTQGTSTRNRGVALTTPVILGGWGFDINDNPTPSGPDGQFLSNINKRPDQWKVGPLDTRWDNGRGVWTVKQNNPFDIVFGKLNGNLAAPGSFGTLTSFNIDVYESGSPTSITATGSQLTCYNADVSLSASGTNIFVIAAVIGKHRFPLWVGCGD